MPVPVLGTPPQTPEHAVIQPAWFVARQGRNGGWGYAGPGEATEPGVYALLALATFGPADSAAYSRGLAWLNAVRRPDGGFAPRLEVARSTWVTALPLLLPSPAAGMDQAVEWILAQTGRESSWVQRLRMALIGSSYGFDVRSDGWPWFPGAAAWVMPTAITVLALQKRQRHHPDARVLARIRSGTDFLLARMCVDGGWNHGASRSLGYEAASYPETTGAALLAIAELPRDKAARSVDTAERLLAATRSREAAAWLQLGLVAHGRRPERKEFRREPSTVPEAALSVLADCAMSGRNLFLE
jgi:hypothetical protein